MCKCVNRKKIKSCNACKLAFNSKINVNSYTENRKKKMSIQKRIVTLINNQSYTNIRIHKYTLNSPLDSRLADYSLLAHEKVFTIDVLNAKY